MRQTTKREEAEEEITGIKEAERSKVAKEIFERIENKSVQDLKRASINVNVYKDIFVRKKSWNKLKKEFGVEE